MTRIKAQGAELRQVCGVIISKPPFATPSRLPPDLERVRAYWRGLLRGSADIPFADDANLPDLPDLRGRLFLIEAFSGPRRFRIDLLGDELPVGDLAGRFVDEAQPGPPFEYLAAQCDATVEAAVPTYYRHEGEKAYARLLLPLWADGRISTLLGIVQRG